ncbi:MAG TPA: hypothetical protein VN903_21420 [Polyangia bacterium]|jgi:hypothetical protein|nr:hypothetical protein [Polyangia bacterium]
MSRPGRALGLSLTLTLAACSSGMIGGASPGTGGGGDAGTTGSAGKGGTTGKAGNGGDHRERR